MKRRILLSGIVALMVLQSSQPLNATPFSDLFSTINVLISSIFTRKKSSRNMATPASELPVVEPINLAAIELPAAVNYADKNFLKQYDIVHKALLRDGYTQVSFLTPDNLRLYGLFLERPHARATVIVCNGFFPGRKETSAPLTALISHDMNILLFDARSHGNSQGENYINLFKGFGMFSNIASYGRREYNDIVGAVHFIADKTGKPILIHGMCSGAFNAIRAAIKLHETGELAHLQVKGIISDSGWASVKSAADNAPFAFVEKELTNKYKRNHQTPTQTQQTSSYKTAYNFFAFLIGAFKKLFIDRGLRRTDAKTNLSEGIRTLPIPIFFIHSADDTYSPFQDVEELSQHVAHQYAPWWIEPGVSYHTDHHFKLPDEYRTKMHTFFSYALIDR